MSKCKGCGISLQNTNPNNPGYTPKLDNKLCQRCFKITHYNYHEIDSKILDNDTLIQKINSRKSQIIFLCDVINLSNETIKYYNKLNNPKVFVLTKTDLIPKNIEISKVLKNIQDIYHIQNIYAFSIKKSTENNLFISFIKKQKNLLFVGPTSSGKSSLINYLFDSKLTVSNYKNTTQEFVDLSIDGITITDAPGFVNENLIDKYANQKIKVSVIHVKKGYELVIDNNIIGFLNDTNITCFLPKGVLLKTRKIRHDDNNIKHLENYTDIVLYNYGFIYFKNEASVCINSDTKIEIRKSIIGGL